MSLIDDAKKCGLLILSDTFYSDSSGEEKLATLKALWLSGGQEPVGYVREDNLLLGDVIASHTITRDKVEPDDVPLYLAAPTIPPEKSRIAELEGLLDLAIEATTYPSSLNRARIRQALLYLKESFLYLKGT